MLPDIKPYHEMKYKLLLDFLLLDMIIFSASDLLFNVRKVIKDQSKLALHSE